MRPPRLSLLAVLVCVAGPLRAASFEDRVEALFRPPLGETIALAPDGGRVAYTQQRESGLAIVMLNLDHVTPKRSVRVGPEPGEMTTSEVPPMRLRFLRWSTPNRLVYAPAERLLATPPPTASGETEVPPLDGPYIVSPILAVDADGRQRGTLIDARDFLETSAEARTMADLLRTPKQLAATRTSEPARWRIPHLEILGFVPEDREQLVVGTRGGFKESAQYLVDTRLGSVRSFGGDWEVPPGEPLVFDWYRRKRVGERKIAARPTTVWHDDELGRVQRELEIKFPRRNVEILDWSETRARVLFRVTGGSDPGRFFVFQRPENLVLEVLRRAPWLSAAKLNETRFFEFETANGIRLSGYLTWPRKTRQDPPPLLVRFPSAFPGRAQPAFDPEAEVLADMGFAVARLNHRCVAGVTPRDLTTLRSELDRVSVADAVAAIKWLAAHHAERPFDSGRIATLGQGFGGYLAVRALQLEAAMFRCGIAVDAPMDLHGWCGWPETGAASENVARELPAALFAPPGVEWKRLSVLDDVEALGSPVCLLAQPGRDPAIDVSSDQLRARLTGLGRTVDGLALDQGFATGLTASRVAAYRKIEEFLNLHLLGYAVEVGPVTEVK